MKLRLGLQRVGSVVFGRVLEQDESLRSNGMAAKRNGTIVGYIASSDLPYLYSESLYIRGSNRDCDNDWFACDYDDEVTAIQVVEDIKALVKMVNSGGTTKEPEGCGLEVIE